LKNPRTEKINPLIFLHPSVRGGDADFSGRSSDNEKTVEMSRKLSIDSGEQL
jgi:hypothetical protein